MPKKTEMVIAMANDITQHQPKKEKKKLYLYVSSVSYPPSQCTHSCGKNGNNARHWSGGVSASFGPLP